MRGSWLRKNSGKSYQRPFRGKHSKPPLLSGFRREVRRAEAVEGKEWGRGLAELAGTVTDYDVDDDRLLAILS